ncbi:helix-turn-helix domain-containing protein [Glaciecola sp. SC05]|uniref:helix-turn-helix domain-containing protein n=1 Tax=Glaciecola sp. SC05 TaxID=1987355 RepID=UPI003528D507
MNTTNSNSQELRLTNIDVQQVIGMFDLLPDVLFWVKDTNSAIVHANKVFLEHLGVKSLQVIKGKTDECFFPYYLARQYLTDDIKVMAGELITDRLELNMLKSGGYGWFSTSKRPLINKQGMIIGSYGFTQHLEKTSHLLSTIDGIRVPVEYVRANYASSITVEQLAELSFLSVSALERRFKRYLSKTPKQFINQVRLENARRLIMEGEGPIADVALACGFSDQSYFSKQFKSLFAVQPSKVMLHVQKLNSLP